MCLSSAVVPPGGDTGLDAEPATGAGRLGDLPPAVIHSGGCQLERPLPDPSAVRADGGRLDVYSHGPSSLLEGCWVGAHGLPQGCRARVTPHTLEAPAWRSFSATALRLSPSVNTSS